MFFSKICNFSFCNNFCTSNSKKKEDNDCKQNNFEHKSFCQNKNDKFDKFECTSNKKHHSPQDKDDDFNWISCKPNKPNLPNCNNDKKPSWPNFGNCTKPSTPEIPDTPDEPIVPDEPSKPNENENCGDLPVVETPDESLPD